MNIKTRKASEALALALALLQKEEKQIDETRKPVISTSLTEPVLSLLTVIIQYERLSSFMDQIQFCDNWRLERPYKNEGYYGVHNVEHKDKLWGARSETEKIVLAFQGQVWAFNLTAENLPGIVKAISTLPQLIRLWQAEVARKKVELIRHQEEWDAKRVQVEQELAKTEGELKALCREIIQASQQVLQQTDSIGD
jgi:hypothetical protein